MNNKSNIQNFFIFALLIVFLITCIAMLQPFFTVILWTTLLYILVRPLHHRVISKFNRKKKFYRTKCHLIAALFSVGILLLIITPVFFLCLLLFQELAEFIQQLTLIIKQNPDIFSQNGPLGAIISFFNNLGINIPDFEISNLRTYILQFTQTYSSKVLSFGTSIVSKTGNFFISLIFIVFALYFCFLDGQYLASVIKKALPVKTEYINILTKKFTRITRNLFSGYIMVALYQGIVSFVIMSIFRVNGALLFSVVLMIASFIPLFGASIVWIPIGIVLCFSTTIIKGVLFLLICGFCVSFLDNFLRPFLLKDRINVHPLIIFFAILGGINVFGMNGLILGPLVVILFFTVLDIINSEDKTKQQIKQIEENKNQ
jgi:predicted PurR-regulated permease PerM